jgi:hypothetical protein
MQQQNNEHITMRRHMLKMLNVDGRDDDILYTVDMMDAIFNYSYTNTYMTVQE